MANLRGKTALVLGGIRGIGKACALALAREGANVAVNWFDWETDLPALERDLSEAPGDHVVLRTNLLDTGAVPEMVGSVAKRYGGLDILVNNIERGGWPVVHGPYTKEQWDLEFATTLRAKWWAFDAALPYLRAGGNGCVVNVSSIAGLVGRAGPASLVFSDGYAAANRGVETLTRTWARLGAPDVRVCELMLGLFDTRHGPGTRGWEALSREQRQALLDHIPLGRTGSVEDAAKAVVFLTRDAVYMTGAILRLDGGYVLGGEEVAPMPPGIVSPDESVFGE
ncbi:MAG: SDR family NAD(P)-dependent oxidoreductase [Desulfatibacillaceae bacterium]